VGAVVVTGKDGSPQGMITRKDVIRAITRHRETAFTLKAEAIMSTPVLTVSSDEDIEFAFLLMSLNKIRRLPVTEGKSLAGIITHRDITNTWRKSYYFMQEQHEELKNEANTDWLTGLYNRKFMSTELKAQVKAARKYGTPLSAVMIDVDCFKSINDTYGHRAGDEVLKDIAMIIRQKTRDANISGRYGGDEFLILAPLADSSSASHMAERLVDIIAGYTFGHDGRRINATVSAGVATWTDSHRRVEDLVSDADKAMYNSKKSGKNRVTSAEESCLFRSGNSGDCSTGL
jgi:diguanylate cyclase (GGDEF)-like protein